ncbi:hypothetical protein [Streptomyces sp. KR55]|uniref:hypothetical protein n=1 Tax=Streptomyces sp. KR55 TaxID=3457425 RepID=UPI003FD58143
MLMAVSGAEVELFGSVWGLGLIRCDGHPRSGVVPREDVHHGEHGEEEAASSALVHTGFKAEIVDLWRRGDRSVGQVANFDLTETAMQLWGSQAEVDAGEGEGLTSSERRRVASWATADICAPSWAPMR